MAHTVKAAECQQKAKLRPAEAETDHIGSQQHTYAALADARTDGVLDIIDKRRK